MRRDEFEKNMKQLMHILKKILKNHHMEESGLGSLFESKDLEKMVLNLCFFNFIPMSQEEFGELEEAFSNLAEGQEAHPEDAEDDFSWNEDDLRFLKQHGIKL